MDFNVRFHVCTVNTEQALLFNNQFNNFGLGNLMMGVISTCVSLPCKLHQQNQSYSWAALNDFTDTCVSYASGINIEGYENEMPEITSTLSQSQRAMRWELHFIWTRVQWVCMNVFFFFFLLNDLKNNYLTYLLIWLFNQ